jgi:putative oxidoreductase
MRAMHDTGWTSAAAPGPGRPGAAGPLLHAALRAGAALLFMQHGVQKLLGGLGGVDGSGGTVPLASLFGLAGLLELVGGALLLLGLLTRPLAFLLAVEMVVAYGMAHLPRGGLPVQNQGELALLYALVFAFLAGSGAGPLSLDRWMARRRHHGGEPGTEAGRVPEIPRRRQDTAA